MKYDKDIIQSMYDSGKTVKQIAVEIGVTEQAVYKKLKLDSARNKFGQKHIDTVEAQLLYDNGLSIRKLAKHFAVSTQTIVRLNLNTRDQAAASAAMKTRVWSDAGLKTLSDQAKIRNLGGYRPHPNKGQYFDGVWFDSKWEVLVASSLNEHNIDWIRPKIGFVWTNSGRKYYPDFYLPKFDVYLDPKNPYLMIKDMEKIREAQLRNNIKVILLNQSQLSWEIINTLL